MERGAAPASVTRICTELVSFFIFQRKILCLRAMHVLAHSVARYALSPRTHRSFFEMATDLLYSETESQ